MTLVVVTLRPASAADADTVAEVWRGAWHDGHRGHVPEALIEARDPAYFRQRSRELVEHVTVAEDDGRLLGVVIVRDDELQQLMVTAAARGLHAVGMLTSKTLAAHGPVRDAGAMGTYLTGVLLGVTALVAL